ncbi:MAG: hypothetical protein PHD81_03100 [Candidatus Nanoarchaeia archaeon]|nr:hypothetical protein [Candidatus Nanoarchaeia archaeon]MDD5588071.1 hypothetical protein [Candidatus Nanoarchaeia archaeon]
MKCDICKKSIEPNFLEKIFGSYIKKDGKKKVVCNACQSKYKDKITEQL